MESQSTVANILHEVDQLLSAENLEIDSDFYTRLIEIFVGQLHGTQGCVWNLGANGTPERLAVAGIPDYALASRRVTVRDSQAVHSVLLESNPTPDGVWIQSTDDLTPRSRRYRLRLPVVNGSECVACITVDMNEDAPAAEEEHQQTLTLTTAALERLNQFHTKRFCQQLKSELTQRRAADRLIEHISQFHDLTQLGNELVNRLQEYLSVDRVSLNILRGGVCQTIAISNQAAFDRRSEVVRSLESISQYVVKDQQPIWYPDEQLLPANIKSRIEHHFGIAHCLTLAALPLFEKPAPSLANKEDLGKLICEQQSTPIGVVLIENMEQGWNQAQLQSSWNYVRKTIENTTSHACADDRSLLLPWARKLARIRDFYRGQRGRKAAIIALISLFVLASLFLVQDDFRLRGEGEVHPVLQRHVFAETSGTIKQLLVSEGQYVQQGDLLARLESPELSARWEELKGLLNESQEQLKTILLQRVRREFSSVQEERDLVNRSVTLETRVAGLKAQLAAVQQQMAKLEIRSPLSGNIITWDINTRLSARPISSGQRLLTIADHSQGCKIELRIPDKRAGYLIERWNQSQQEGKPMDVSFILSSQPRETHQGLVLDVARNSQADARDADNVVRVVVALAPETAQKLANTRAGTSVIGHIHCGTASIGYCKLYEFFDWTKRTWFRYI